MRYDTKPRITQRIVIYEQRTFFDLACTGANGLIIRVTLAITKLIRQGLWPGQPILNAEITPTKPNGGDFSFCVFDGNTCLPNIITQHNHTCINKSN